MPKRGYTIDNSTIEIYEGNVDVILYNSAKKPKIKFYFYRFPFSELFPKASPPEVDLLDRPDVEKFLNNIGFDYDTLRYQLVNYAEATDKEVKYDM